MSTDSEAMGQVIYQAAIEIAQGRKTSIKSALVAACRRLRSDDPDEEAYGPLMWKECIKVIGYIGWTEFPSYQNWRGGSWYAPDVKSWVVVYLLFCYEYVVTEISGGRGRVPQIVTPRNECDGSQTDLCRHPETQCD